jgi:uncharacterized protein (DUF2252 family)
MPAATGLAPANGATSGVPERMERGKAARRAVPRRSHAEWAPAPGRRDPVDIVEQESEGRVPELVPIRYGRMLASPFTFYRGAAAIMAADLAGTPTSGIDVQLCGDAHLSNFGIFAAPDRRLVFDLNDFDETHEGPWEWDVKRLAASLEIAGRDRGFSQKRRQAVVLRAVASYRKAMRSFAEMSNLDVWYARLDVDEFLAQQKGGAPAARRAAAKARSKNSGRAAAKLTEIVDGRLRIRNDPPLVVRLHEFVPEREANELEAAIQEVFDGYVASLTEDRRRLISTYRIVDIAHKVVGVGSVGTRAWIVLLEGRDGSDPLVLQAKEAGPSVLEPHTAASPYDNHGRRVVEGQRLMQGASDILLGWLHITAGLDGNPRDFYMRQLWDGKASAEIETMGPTILARYGELCGWALARAHARSGDRVAIASYLGSGDQFDRAVVSFAEAYADVNDADYAAMQAAVDDGRLAIKAG